MNTSIISKGQKSAKKLPTLLKKITEENVMKYNYVSKSTKNKKSINVFEDMFYDLEFKKPLKSSRLPKYNNIFDLFNSNIKKIDSKSNLNTNDFSMDESNKNLIDLKNRININENNLIKKNDLSGNNEDDDELILSLESNIVDDSDINLNLPSQSCKTLPFAFKSDKLKNLNAKITRKTNFKFKIKENISEYVQGYLDYFMDNIADKIIKDYEKNSNEISNELNNEGVNYFNQERQMTFLIEDDDETYKNQIKDIVKGLREEAENKKKKL